MALFPDVGDGPLSVEGFAQLGATLNYQVVYRNTVTFCTSGTTNTTNAYRITWVE